MTAETQSSFLLRRTCLTFCLEIFFAYHLPACRETRICCSFSIKFRGCLSVAESAEEINSLRRALNSRERKQSLNPGQIVVDFYVLTADFSYNIIYITTNAVGPSLLTDLVKPGLFLQYHMRETIQPWKSLIHCHAKTVKAWMLMFYRLFIILKDQGCWISRFLE